MGAPTPAGSGSPAQNSAAPQTERGAQRMRRYRAA